MSSRASSPQQGSPISSPASPSALRNRGAVASSSSVFVAGGFPDAVNTSPTLSSFSASNTMSLVTGGDEQSPSARPRRIVIRVDPSIATCFDPADKELYDLWASKA
ncbi:hypothetical protein BC827DRAFT_1265018 [Russula dissimulans]|nr:hypothetical protein BC827DRAFT_1265018 [Russula dissimulans]